MGLIYHLFLNPVPAVNPKLALFEMQGKRAESHGDTRAGRRSDLYLLFPSQQPVHLGLDCHQAKRSVGQLATRLAQVDQIGLEVNRHFGLLGGSRQGQCGGAEGGLHSRSRCTALRAALFFHPPTHYKWSKIRISYLPPAL